MPGICITTQSTSHLVDNVHLLLGKCMMCLSSKVFFPLFYTDHLEDLVCGMHTSVLMMLQCVNARGFPCLSLKYTPISSTGLQLDGNHSILLLLLFFKLIWHRTGNCIPLFVRCSEPTTMLLPTKSAQVDGQFYVKFHCTNDVK